MNTVARPADTPARDGFRHGDPVLALTEHWRDVHARALALCRRQQQLESRIARTNGYLPSCCTEGVSGTTGREQGGTGPRYSEAKAAEEHFARETARLLEELAQTPAHSMDGVVAKLEVLLLESEVGDGPSDFPWPHLRSVLGDIRRLTGAEPSSHRDPP
ncbi:hypothetical protein QEZ48_16445 [Aquamicrobium lusatiense]|uniref:hypothetical protein n=1 Tax=Aquamicrobium lusatiense TaxID=89772 RepID=UPI002455DD81|nr:hypothetical protein [Aquamicrobium lusatiense]MDH4992404.1 hypothetical protein [Aquamicrobium lusatiense]